MNNCNTVVGLDVHKKTIVTGVLPPQADRVTESVAIENHSQAIKKMVQRLSGKGPLEFVYEAGPCGYEVQRQIMTLGYKCVVIAPSLTPRRPGDRVKTDRRDAEKLARLYRAGELTMIHVPTREDEAARDLVRVREDALSDRTRAQHRLSKFLLRQGRVFQGAKSWGVVHLAWLATQRFEWPALQQTFTAYVRILEERKTQLKDLDQQLQDLALKEPYRIPVQYLRCLKGIDTLSALTLAVEVQEFKRFGKAGAFMSYVGAVPSEHSSGPRIHRGSITKTGNPHVRRILVESAWNYRRCGLTSKPLEKRREGCPLEVIDIAKKAENRLHRKYWRLVGRGKLHQVAVVAVARELAGFVWSIAQCFPANAS